MVGYAVESVISLVQVSRGIPHGRVMGVWDPTKLVNEEAALIAGFQGLPVSSDNYIHLNTVM